MFLTKITLHNWCQHRHVEQVIEGHLIGILGNNGTGKTNFLESLMFGFNGAIPGRDKAGLITDGETEGYVQLEFKHGSMECSVYRALHNTDAILKLGDETIEGITKVNAALAERIGIDKEISKQTMFVRQDELNSILFTEPAVRERSWHAMAGLSDATKIYNNLGPVLSRIPEPTDYSEIQEQLIERIGSEWSTYRFLMAEKGTAETAFAQLDSSVSVESINALTELKGAVDAAASAAQTHAEMEATLRSEQELLNKADESVVALHAQHDVNMTIEQELTEATVSANQLKQQYNNAQSLKLLQTKLADAQVKLDCAQQEKLPDAAMAQSELDRVTKQIAEITGLVQAYKPLLEAFRANMAEFGNKCPLCHSDVQDPNKLLAELVQKVDDFNREIGTQTVMQGEHRVCVTAANQAIERHNQELATLQSSVATIEGQVKMLDSAEDSTVTEEDVTQAGEKVQRLTALSQQIITLNNEISTRSGRTNQLNMTLTTAAGEVAKHSSKVKELMAKTKADITKLDEAIDTAMTKQTEFDKAREAVSSNAARIEEMRRAIRRLIGDLRTTRNKDAAQDDFRALRKTAENIRNWFHYSQGPHRVVTDILCQLTPDVNDFLGRFGSPYMVTPDPENVLFRYAKGAPIPGQDELPSATRLSGGERVMLAVSFRIACYCMFASKLGLLTLDEPTVWLDGNNVQMFGHLLEKLKEITSIMNLQIFMSTHELSVIPLLDTAINLNAKNKE